MERTYLSENSIINIKGAAVQIDAAIDGGSTCLAYYGRIKESSQVVPGTRVIIKEFYPSGLATLDICRDNGKLKVPGWVTASDAYQKKKKQFEDGYRIQRNLAGDDHVMEVVVTPFMYGDYGDSAYLISDIHSGICLDKVSFKTLEQKLACAVRVIEMVGILHNAGYLLTDFKPENILWTDHPKAVKLVDVDSVFLYEERAEKDDPIDSEHFLNENLLYINKKYCSEQFKKFAAMVSDGRVDFEEKKKVYLRPQENIYSLGVYLFELLFGRMPEKTEDLSEDGVFQRMQAELLSRYKEELKDKASAALLLEVIRRATLKRPGKRYSDGYEMMDGLNHCIGKITSYEYLPKKEIAKANADFAAYNMLQKYPLFRYAVPDKYGTKQIKVVMTGNHAMRSGMLSAVISIGQMLHTELSVYLVDKDAVHFWDIYTSKACNSALKSAVTWTVDGRTVSGQVDRQLVARPLAAIHLVTDTSEDQMKALRDQNQCTYFILLDKNPENNRKMSEYLFRDAERKIFIGYLQENEGPEICENTEPSTDVFAISGASFSESYNEKMFEERIYKMGLMAHAYYCGCMKENASVNLEALEKEFRQDMYNVASSERCALHSIYKMASIGIDRDHPGRFLNFYRKIQQPDILEALAWLEHLSWTAYMLTSGANPVTVSQLDTYVYKNDNDWKNKADPAHIGHPLLAASYPEKRLPEDHWETAVTQEMRAFLDPLDSASYGIFRWYRDHRGDFKEKLCHLLDIWKAEVLSMDDDGQIAEGLAFHEILLDNGIKIIEAMAAMPVNQETEKLTQWKTERQEAQIYARKCRNENLNALFGEMDQMMKPVFDAYKDRDYKKLDRDLVFAAIDMIA